MISAIIDLGSNTIRLCVYEYQGNEVKSIFEKKEMAGLVNYVENEKLSNQGIDKACDTLDSFIGLLDNLAVKEENIHIFATASLRNIVNTKEVTDAIRDRTNYEVELLSGEEEATLDFIGSTKCLAVEEGVLVDIGGGSTEIVLFDHGGIRYATSIPIGSLNMYVRNVKKIIPKEDERKAIRETVIRHLSTLELEGEPCPAICGVGGTFRSIAKLNNSIYHLPVGNIEIVASHLKEMLAGFKNSHRDTLSPILRNVPDRIHTIIPGMLIADTIAGFFSSDNITVSKYGLREGYLYERIIKGE